MRLNANFIFRLLKLNFYSQLFVYFCFLSVLSGSVQAGPCLPITDDVRGLILFEDFYKLLHKSNKFLLKWETLPDQIPARKLISIGNAIVNLKISLEELMRVQKDFDLTDIKGCRSIPLVSNQAWRAQLALRFKKAIEEAEKHIGDPSSDRFRESHRFAHRLYEIELALGESLVKVPGAKESTPVDHLSKTSSKDSSSKTDISDLNSSNSSDWSAWGIETSRSGSFDSQESKEKGRSRKNSLQVLGSLVIDKASSAAKNLSTRLSGLSLPLQNLSMISGKGTKGGGSTRSSAGSEGTGFQAAGASVPGL